MFYHYISIHVRLLIKVRSIPLSSDLNHMVLLVLLMILLDGEAWDINLLLKLVQWLTEIMKTSQRCVSLFFVSLQHFKFDEQS